MSFTVLFSQLFVCGFRLFADWFFVESLFSIVICLSFSLPISCKRYGPSFMDTDKYLYTILYRLNVLEFLYLLIVTTPMILEESILQRCKILRVFVYRHFKSILLFTN